MVTFPGGVVDEIDRAGSPGHGLDCVRAKCQREDVMYRMAAVRELAEETGLVLDTDVSSTDLKSNKLVEHPQNFKTTTIMTRLYLKKLMPHTPG